ncbi:intradiol ring-cleavage dioxygenase [Roseateles chitosanitabidus]|jgi:protocatechuate 3,4-dioxygenase beta subunit|uniref:intradiol ring-cleavage dioxygenase n=1 Tax=Roseateles chitosanitabidus TaxID=65048 RepID=UPI0008346169|nr:intradiol ring-cleavage dioxygenase [Roseateles chitosanitabidus]MBO9685248.1 intradiol ring-cleavage dioxygenase [Roseateles chitosanitabidus]
MQPPRHAFPADHDDDHDQGLAHDLRVMQQRRRALGLLAGLAGIGGLTLVGCGGGGSETGTSTTSSSSSGSTSTGTTTTASCSVIPEETAGPYPGDGSNSNGSGIANALSLSGIVRSDIRGSIGTASGTAGGVPLTLTLKLVNTSSSCADLSGYAIYLWHCDREGRYSLYSSSIINENYLRGVQSTGSDGTVTFTTIFPGCYDGRMPHMHFEVYRTATAATSYANKIKTSQIAFPTDVCTTVYTSATGYASSLTNFNRISFATDNVFSDGYTTQLATLSGSVSAGYTATLTVGIAA